MPLENIGITHIKNNNVLLSASKLVLNGLKVHFNLNKYCINAYNGVAIAIASRVCILYEMNFTKVNRVDGPNLVKFLMRYGMLEF